VYRTIPPKFSTNISTIQPYSEIAPIKKLLLSGVDGDLEEVPLHIKMTVHELGERIELALHEYDYGLPHRLYIPTDLLVLWTMGLRMKLHTYSSRTGAKNIVGFLCPAALHLQLLWLHSPRICEDRVLVGNCDCWDCGRTCSSELN
jgi:hypothetical protein